MNCPHYQPLTRDGGTCSLGLYGGKPSHGVCGRCIAAGENTPEFAKALQERAEISHPSSRPRISGCCDRADRA